MKMDLDQVEGPVRKGSISSSPPRAVIGIATVQVYMPHLSFHEVGVDILQKARVIAVMVTIVEANTAVLREVEKVVADSIMGTTIHIVCLMGMVMDILLPLRHICTAMVILVILMLVMDIHMDMGTVQLITLLRMECMDVDILPLEHLTIHPTTIVTVHLHPYLNQSTTMPIKCLKRNVARWTILANPRNRPSHLDEKRCTVIMSV